MDANQLILWHGKQTKGIVIAQVLLCCKGQLGNVVQAFDIIWGESDSVELFLIKRHMLITVMHHLDQACGLQGVQILTRCFFDLRLEVTLLHSSMLLLFYKCMLIDYSLVRTPASSSLKTFLGQWS